MEEVVTVCSYCTSGCKINLIVDDGRIVRAGVTQEKTNQGILCLKGYYGWNLINDTQALAPCLKTLMICRQRGDKLEPASWDETLSYVAERLSAIKKKHGPDAIQMTGSSRGMGNETSYVMQKFARTVTGTSNADCCARIRHGPSVIGLHQSIGNGVMSDVVDKIDNTGLAFVFGYNPTDSHPIVANHVINAKRNGAEITAYDPCKTETARIADMHTALKNGSNITLLNTMDHVIIEENLYDRVFVASRTEDLEKYCKIVESYTPESVEDIAGVSASEICQAVRMYAQAEGAAILWGMGAAQFYQDVETVRSLTSLTMLADSLGKPHASVNPVRGQDNVQGAYDMGALPDMYPGYQYVRGSTNRRKFAKAWGVESLPAHTGCRTSELPHRVVHGEVGMTYIVGEDPPQTDVELSAVHKAFEDLRLAIVQDIFITKTMSVADVILPSASQGEHEGIFTTTGRGFQCFFKAVEPE